MTFTDAMKNMILPEKCIIPSDELGYWNVNINFINNEGQEDQTQFDIFPYQFDYVQRRCDALNELWKEFCKENRFNHNSITSIELVI